MKQVRTVVMARANFQVAGIRGIARKKLRASRCDQRVALRLPYVATLSLLQSFVDCPQPTSILVNIIWLDCQLRP